MTFDDRFNLRRVARLERQLAAANARVAELEQQPTIATLLSLKQEITWLNRFIRWQARRIRELQRGAA